MFFSLKSADSHLTSHQNKQNCQGADLDPMLLAIFFLASINYFGSSGTSVNFTGFQKISYQIGFFDVITYCVIYTIFVTKFHGILVFWVKAVWNACFCMKSLASLNFFVLLFLKFGSALIVWYHFWTGHQNRDADQSALCLLWWYF